MSSHYRPDPQRYDGMTYRSSGRSGLRLPAVSLGLWHNFGGVDILEESRKMLLGAFDRGITHFDLANNYGPPPGSAEETLGRIVQSDLRPYRDELIISTKAGYQMWNGPYGDWGSRKYLLSSLDQSLSRMKLDYVDIFYHHRPDPQTPMEESLGALDTAVRRGKALYAGISNYSAEQTGQAAGILRALGTPCLIHQPAYSLFRRWIEDGLLSVLEKQGIGCIAFSPLAQGLLTDRYLAGIPAGSRADKDGFLKKKDITEEKLHCILQLREIALARGQSLAQMALAWVLRHPAMTSVLIGASSLAQLEENLASLQHPTFTPDELARIDGVLRSKAEGQRQEARG